MTHEELIDRSIRSLITDGVIILAPIPDGWKPDSWLIKLVRERYWILRKRK